MNSINFTANFLKTQTIQRRKPFFRHENQKVSIVELDRNNENDRKTLSDVNRIWRRQGGLYIENILDNAIYPYQSTDILGNHFIALTTQNENFEKLNPNDILGVMLFREKRGTTHKISFLETKPTTNHKRYFRKYKQVGRRLIEFVQDKYKKDIELQPDKNAIKFYKKMGFIKDPDNEAFFRWEATV